MPTEDNKPIKVGNFYPPQIKVAKTGEYRELTDETYNTQSVQTVSVLKQYFEGSGNLTKEFDEDMHGLSIYNNHKQIMHFVIDGVSVPVFPESSWSDVFKDAFRTVSIIASGPWHVMPLQRIGAAASIVEPEPPDTTAPDNVTNLEYSNVTQNSATLNWKASLAPDTYGYEIWQGGALLTTVTATTFTAVGLNPSTQYTYTVKAKDRTGNVASGTSVNVTTDAQPVDTTPPNNVTGLMKSNVTQTGVTLTWVASTSSDIKDYRIYNGSTLITTVTGLTYNVTGLTADTDYTFTVKARDNANNEASGVPVNVRTTAAPPVDPPEPVSGLTAGTPTATTIPITWTKSPSASVTALEMACSKDGTSFTIASASVNPNVTSFEFTDLTANTPYTLRVVAIDGAGKRSTAVTVQATTAGASLPSITDSFTGANGTLLNGRATETGNKTWTDITGVWKITGNQACLSADISDGVSVIDTGHFNGVVSVKIAAGFDPASTVQYPRLMLRVVDANNFLTIQALKTSYEIWKKTSGTYKKLGTLVESPANGDVIRATCNGSTIGFQINNGTIQEFIITDLQTATRHGIGSSRIEIKLDDFSFTPSEG